jgi:hypothetical protein
VNNFSLTISKPKGDVSLTVLDKLFDFIKRYCLKGGASTEVGSRAHNLHLQSILSIRYPKTKQHIKVLVNMIKTEVIKPLPGYKIHLKPFATNQTFAGMIGYITKDQGEYYYSSC